MTIDKTFDFAGIEAKWAKHWEESGAYRPHRPEAEPYTPLAVYNDCFNSWKLLKNGGVMAINDYRWIPESGDLFQSPMVGIDLFLNDINNKYELVEKSYQVWIKKK